MGGGGGWTSDARSGSATRVLHLLLPGPQGGTSRAGLSGQRALRLLTHRKPLVAVIFPPARRRRRPLETRGDTPGRADRSFRFRFSGRLPGPGSLCPALPSRRPSCTPGASPAAALSCLRPPSLASTPVPQALPTGLAAPQKSQEAWWPEKAWVPDPRRGGGGRWTPCGTPTEGVRNPQMGAGGSSLSWPPGT